MDGHETSRDHDAATLDAVSHRLHGYHLPDSALRAVTEELVARLAQKMRNDSSALGDVLLTPAPKEHLSAFCDALVDSDPAKSRAFFDQLRRSGKTPDALSLNWIAEAARMLGDRWVTDTCGFLDVTIGLSRLHSLQRSLQDAFNPGSVYQPAELSALFAPIPGETHLLGLTMSADFFRRAGWRVDLHCERGLESLCERAKKGNYRLIGLSAGCLVIREALENTVQCLRDALPNVKIVLGGYISRLEPNIKEQVSVDHVFSEGASAPLVCQKLVFPGS